MIDNPVAAMGLLARLQAAMPMPAQLTPEPRISLGTKNAAAPVPAAGAIAALHYLGDKGGIVCKVDRGANMQNEAFLSTTRLRFDPRLLLTCDIAAYQKQRVKRLPR